jgi:hypothetical protein
MNEHVSVGPRERAGLLLKQIVLVNGRRLLEANCLTLSQENRVSRSAPEAVAAALLEILVAPISECGRLADSVNLWEIAQTFSDWGLYTQPSVGDSTEDIALALEQGSAVAIAANIGEVYSAPEFFDCGDANYVFVPVASYRDAMSLQLEGLSLWDPSGDPGARIFVTVEKLMKAWLKPGARMLIIRNEDYFSENL